MANGLGGAPHGFGMQPALSLTVRAPASHAREMWPVYPVFTWLQAVVPLLPEAMAASGEMDPATDLGIIGTSKREIQGAGQDASSAKATGLDVLGRAQLVGSGSSTSRRGSSGPRGTAPVIGSGSGSGSGIQAVGSGSGVPTAHR